MSCLVAKVTVVLSSFSANIELTNKPMAVAATIANHRLIANCSLLCTVGGEKYLNVSPEEVVWISDAESAWYEVESNTEWNVE